MTEPGAEPATDAPRQGLGWRDRDHTRGRLWVSLFVLAVPLVTTSLLQAAYQMIDLGFVSALGEDATTAVIVTNQSIRQIVFMFTMGLGIGAQALVARAIGEGDPEHANRVAGQVLAIGGAIGVLVAAIGLLAPEPLLRAMNVSPEVLAIGVPYVRLTLVLSGGFIFGMMMANLLQGAGDAATPLMLSVVQTAISIVAEYLLIFGKAGFPELGIAGVAWGVAVGQIVSLALAARVLLGGRSRLHLHLVHLRPDPAEIGRILRIAWPPALQMVSGFIVTVFFLRMVGDFGAKAQAAYSIGLRLGMVGPMLAFPMAGACATLVGQNLGAGSVPRAWRSLGVGLVAHVSLLWTVAAALFFFRTPIVSAFADDPEVIRIGSELLVYQAGQFVFWAFYFVFIRGLQGAGDVRVPMLLSIANALLVTLPLGAWLALPSGLDRGPTGIFEASLVGSVTITLTTGAWLATGRWTRVRPH